VICLTCANKSGLAAHFTRLGAKIHKDFNPTHELKEEGETNVDKFGQGISVERRRQNFERRFRYTRRGAPVKPLRYPGERRISFLMYVLLAVAVGAGAVAVWLMR
jgi:hypothetical protein